MNDPLWHQLRDFQISSGEERLTFTARLARENGWSHRHAERVHQEYLRFIFLAAVAGHQVTPSEEVDQAWHLHLCYSRSYWHDLCEGILKKPLHHGPTKGGHQEASRFRDQYRKTLESYRLHFGESPPPDIWPSEDQRFQPTDRFVRVNLKDSFVIPRKPVFWLSAILPAAFLLTGCFSTLESALHGDIVSIAIIVLCIILMISIIRFIAKRSGNHGNGGCGSTCGTAGCGGTSRGSNHDNGSSDGGNSGCGSSGCGGGGCGGGGD